MCNRKSIGPALLATLVAVVSAVGSTADLSNFNKSERFQAVPIVTASLPVTFTGVAATSSLRQSWISAGMKQGPAQAVVGPLHQPNLVPRHDGIIDFNLSQPWQPHNLSVVCDRAPPDCLFG
jgi:hypothetical protein